MTDRELLEMAAKAVGITGLYDEEMNAFVQNDNDYFPTVWRPHLEDGDALRLAVDLNITFRNLGHIMTAVGSGGQFNEYADGDAYAATRRAITRAAAEIGRAMK